MEANFLIAAIKEFASMLASHIRLRYFAAIVIHSVEYLGFVFMTVNVKLLLRIDEYSYNLQSLFLTFISQIAWGIFLFQVFKNEQVYQFTYLS